MKIKISKFFEGGRLFRLEIQGITGDVLNLIQCNESNKKQGPIMDFCRREFCYFTDSKTLEKLLNPGTSVSLSVKQQY